MRRAYKAGLHKSTILLLVRNMIRDKFAGVHVRANFVALSNIETPTVYISNHASLWDGAIASYLTYKFCRQDPFLMTATRAMNAIFTWAGAFSIDPYDPFDIAASIQYAVSLVKSVPRCGLWLFPQGVIYPFSRRPLGFQSGAAQVIKQAGNVRIIPVVFHYAFAANLRPEVFIDFGSSIEGLDTNVNLRTLTSDLQARFETEMNRVQNNIENMRTDLYTTVIHGRHDLQYYMIKLMRKEQPPLKFWGSFSDKQNLSGHPKDTNEG